MFHLTFRSGSTGYVEAAAIVTIYRYVTTVQRTEVMCGQKHLTTTATSKASAFIAPWLHVKKSIATEADMEGRYEPRFSLLALRVIFHRITSHHITSHCGRTDHNPATIVRRHRVKPSLEAPQHFFISGTCALT